MIEKIGVLRENGSCLETFFPGARHDGSYFTQRKLPVPARDLLTQVLRQGAQQMLAQAVEARWPSGLSNTVTFATSRHRQVVGNGYLPERKILTSLS